MWHLDSFVSWDSIFGLAGRRAGALFFARTATVSSPGTASLGWRADALVPCFLLAPRLFIVTRNFTAVYLDLVSFNSFIVTREFSSVYQDWQKTRHRDTDGT